tara:strand:- start:26442 stop:26921 length:480 start_codon:yes stop_codon:yes gene_type:complete
MITFSEGNKKGLWDNIHAKRKRIKGGSGEKMRKPGSEGAPSKSDLENSRTEEVCCSECEAMNEDLISEDIVIMEEGEKKKVALNKVQRGGSKKFYVYVKNDKGNVVKVSFGDPNMEIKRDDPKARASFRARHDCANKKDRTKAGYWSCRQWRGGAKVED